MIFSKEKSSQAQQQNTFSYREEDETIQKLEEVTEKIDAMCDLLLSENFLKHDKIRFDFIDSHYRALKEFQRKVKASRSQEENQNFILEYEIIIQSLYLKAYQVYYKKLKKKQNYFRSIVNHLSFKKLGFVKDEIKMKEGDYEELKKMIYENRELYGKIKKDIFDFLNMQKERILKEIEKENVVALLSSLNVETKIRQKLESNTLIETVDFLQKLEEKDFYMTSIELKEMIRKLTVFENSKKYENYV